jgi:hypothetical protein
VDSIIEFCKKRMFMEASVHQVIYLSLIEFCQEQAKEMEKEQIIMSHIDSAIFTEWDILTDARKNADQYYEQTYGGGEQ